MVISAVLREFRGGGAPTLALHRLAVRAANRPVVFLVLGWSGRVLAVAWVLVRPAGFWKDSACRRVVLSEHHPGLSLRHALQRVRCGR